MNDSSTRPAGSPTVEAGETVYNEAGAVVGIVREVDDGEFTTRILDETETAESYDSSEDIPGRGFGEGYLMWRCGECGEMDELDDGLPEQCPGCGAPREAIGRARED
jgi:rubrerythrin